jgi:hypothetical protein
MTKCVLAEYGKRGRYAVKKSTSNQLATDQYKTLVCGFGNARNEHADKTGKEPVTSQNFHNLL